MEGAGRVYLVGAGPGDPDLLTVKAARLLRDADVVVYDRLVSAEILALIPDGVSRLFVGKQPGHHHVPQQETNQMLVRLARANRCVVRLKGGDPLVFGRGGEEALYLARQAIPFEIVPGITAAMACTAYAGIPVTHRGLAHGVQLVTGHCQADAPLDLDWRSLADPLLTLVVYMGLAQVDRIGAALLGAGRDGATPVAIIESGTTPHQRRVLTTLDRLPETARTAAVASPVLIVIGEDVTLAEELTWFAPEAEPPAADVGQSSAG